jgi:hypothetical protein
MAAPAAGGGGGGGGGGGEQGDVGGEEEEWHNIYDVEIVRTTTMTISTESRVHFSTRSYSQVKHALYISSTFS